MRRRRTSTFKAYAERSFGVFQEEPQEVVLRFAPVGRAGRPRTFSSIRPKTLSDEQDGSLTVRFPHGALLEIAHHLMTWGPAVSIIAPKAYKDTMREVVAGRPCPLLSVRSVSPSARILLERTNIAFFFFFFFFFF